ncbi:hypothetical protein BVRB_6g140480 isoform B [Beta vulgaris subsp. vulgaris]|nr:hypothetical protein BVRB_6g140480 isoform B [Beta vulgaris subsp. vulgaris]
MEKCMVARCYTCRPTEKFSKDLQKLQTLKFVEIPLDHRNSISFALFLFRRSPNLKGLHIKVRFGKFSHAT